MGDKDHTHLQRSNDKKGKIFRRNYTHLHSRVIRVFERHIRTLHVCIILDHTKLHEKNSMLTELARNTNYS